MGTFEYTGFYDLLADSLFNYNQALQHEDPYVQNRYARASTISIILSVESASNCLISSLLGSEVSPGFREELDKLTAIGKFDAYASIKHQKKIDRGRNEVGKFKEMIKMRNAYVHPKTRKLNTNITNVKQLNEELHVRLESPQELWKNLKIPKDSVLWSAASAEIIIKATTDFFSYYFKDILCYTANEADLLLMSKYRFDGVIMSGVYQEFKDEVLNSDFDFSFLIGKST